jgi:hypothetical protein
VWRKNDPSSEVQEKKGRQKQQASDHPAGRLENHHFALPHKWSIAQTPFVQGTILISQGRICPAGFCMTNQIESFHN